MNLSAAEPDHLPELKAIACPANLAYTAWRGLSLGAVGPAVVALWNAPENAETVRQQFGSEQEEMALAWGKAVCFALDRMDEAKRLIAGS